MNRISKALVTGAALSLAVLPVLAQAADVRPSDARISVSPSALHVVPANVRSNAEVANQSGFVGIPFFAIIAAFGGLTAFILIVVKKDRSP